MVAIAVVAVATLTRVGAVEDDGHIVELLLVVIAFDDGKHVAVHQAGTDDENGHVCPLGDDTGVGNDVDRGTVEEDGVVVLTEFAEELLEAGAEQQLGGVGRNGAHGDDINVLITFNGDSDVSPRVNPTTEEISHAALGFADVFRQ